MNNTTIIQYIQSDSIPTTITFFSLYLCLSQIIYLFQIRFLDLLNVFEDYDLNFEFYRLFCATRRVSCGVTNFCISNDDLHRLFYFRLFCFKNFGVDTENLLNQVIFVLFLTLCTTKLGCPNLTQLGYDEIWNCQIL